MRELITLTGTDGFCAGVELEADVVVRAAPMLRYMLGWNSRKVLNYAAKRNWMVEQRDQPAPGARKIEIRTP
jgi:hypothetical protein